MEIVKSRRYLGLVISIKANFLQVELDSLDSAEESHLSYRRLLCTFRRRLHYYGSIAHVGDRVWVEEIDWQHNRGVVSAIESRDSLMDRPPVANVTQVIVAISLQAPSFDLDQASRFLLTAEKIGLDVLFLLTKRDLINDDLLHKELTRLRQWGYRTLAVSVKNEEGISELRSNISLTKLSVICGPSGVGKSSLINKLLPKENITIAPLSRRLKRGKNTTRHVQLYKIGGQSLIADTPGFNRPDLNINPNQIAYCFPEIRNQLNKKPCKFRNCFHLDEPGCVIDRGWERYQFYRRFLQEQINPPFLDEANPNSTHQ